MIEITREMHPQQQDDDTNRYGCVLCSHPTYVSAHGVGMVEIRRGRGVSQMWRSEDNARTWTLADGIATEEARSDGTYAEWTLGPFFQDPARDALIRFQWSSLYQEPPSTLEGYHDLVRAHIPDSYRAFYRISRDGGRTWDGLRQLVEFGPEFDGDHWARGVRFLQGAAVLGAVPPFHTLPDGRLMLPCQIRSTEEQNQYGAIQAGRFLGSWRADGSDVEWRSGGRVYGGGCEQTVTPLRDGRLLNVLRVQGQIEPYPFSPWQRPYSVSEDCGETWSVPEPLSWDDGGGLTTPRAWSQLIRAERNGRLYWIANILPSLAESEPIRRRWPGRADPRYPLHIAELDEQTMRLRRQTLTVIEDRAPGETEYVRFSNFYAYNDRETGDVVLLMMKSYHEDEPNLARAPHPAYRYRIRVPAGP